MPNIHSVIGEGYLTRVQTMHGSSAVFKGPLTTHDHEAACEHLKHCVGALINFADHETDREAKAF